MPHDGEPIFALPEPSLRKDPEGPGAKISEPAWGMSSPPQRRGDLARPRPSTDLSTDLAQPAPAGFSTEKRFKTSIIRRSRYS